METAGFNGADISGMVSKLVADPELLSGLASALGLGDATGEDKAGEKEKKTVGERGAESDARTEWLESLMSLAGGIRGGRGGKSGRSDSRDDARRTALLSALRPYCNPHRQETIDRMISISKLSETLRKLDLNGKRGQ